MSSLCMDVAITGGSLNRDKITGQRGWGGVHLKICISIGESFARYKVNNAL